MSFDTFLDQAWTDHATQPAAVAERIQTQGLALLQQADQVTPLAFLAQHVHGQHLGDWAAGVAFQAALAALPLVAPGSATAEALQRFGAVLQLAGGLADDRPGHSASERVRRTAMAAAALTVHDSARAAALLQEALAGAEAAGLPDADPAVRALAAAGNNIALALEEVDVLDDNACQLMVMGAQVGRRFWARAGGWLEVERAEYRLAMSWMKAGDAAQARKHAQGCLDIVQAQPVPGAPALEHHFGWEALGRVERAAGDAAGHAQALRQAEAWFAQLAESDAAWCRAGLEALRTPPADNRPAATLGEPA